MEPGMGLESRVAAERAAASSESAPPANWKWPVLFALLGAIVTTLITLILGKSETANAVAAIVGAVIPAFATSLSPKYHQGLGLTLAAIVVALALTYGAFTILDAATGEKTFPGPVGSSTLELGDTGAEVEELEQLLQAEGFPPGAIDGHFDDDTEQAVKDFQNSEGIAADGVVGGQTWTALRD